MKSQSKSPLVERAARWFVRRKVGKTDDIQRTVRRARAAGASSVMNEVAEPIVRRAAFRAFLTGTLGGPWTAIPLALIDLDGATSAEAKLAATAAYAGDEAFFARPSWDRELVYAMLDVDPEPEPGGALTKSLAKRLALSRVKKLAIRTLTNTVPVIGGAIGGGVEYILLKRRAARFEGRFGDRRSARAAAPPSASDIRDLQVPAPPPTASPTALDAAQLD